MKDGIKLLGNVSFLVGATVFALVLLDVTPLLCFRMHHAWKRV